MEERSTGIETWREEDCNQVQRAVLCLPHHLDECELFTDQALEALLDIHPRERLQCYTMNADTSDIDGISPVDVGDASGADMMLAMRKGMLWFNVRALQDHHAEYASLTARMVDELKARCPELQSLGEPCVDLLISSPHAQTHYHMDRGPNLLWHIRGKKKIWIYPRDDEELAPQELVENIYADESLEYMPWQPSFDSKATMIQLQPGDVVSWPNGSPHRVVNGSTCVSLSFSFTTAASIERVAVFRANRYLLRPFGLTQRCTDSNSPVGKAKTLLFKAGRKLGGFQPKVDYRAENPTRWRVDAGSACGLRELSRPVLPAFFRKARA